MSKRRKLTKAEQARVNEVVMSLVSDSSWLRDDHHPDTTSDEPDNDRKIDPEEHGCEDCRAAIDAWRGNKHEDWPIEQPCGQLVRMSEDTNTCFVECPDQERSMDLQQCPACNQVWLRLSCNKCICDCDSVLLCFTPEDESVPVAAPLSDEQVAELRAHRGLWDLIVNDYCQFQG